jgi:hypothetical protein
LPGSVQYVFDQPLIEQPGTHFTYNSGGSHLLSVMVSQAAGMSTLEFARRELFAPLGISDVQWALAEDGMNLGGAGLQMLPRDMAKFGQLYLQKGRWDDQQVIPQEWVDASSQPYVSYQPDINYGYQWWIPKEMGYVAVGWGNQNIWVLPDQDMVVVFTAGVKNDSLLPHAKYLQRYILPAVRSTASLPPNPQGEARLAAELKSAQYPSPRSVQPLPPIADKIVGKTYQITGASITMGFQSISIGQFTADEALIHVGLTGEDVDLRAGLDGVFRRSQTKSGEIALKATWEDEQTLEIIWQDLQSAERAICHLTFRGDQVEIKVDLYIEGISEISIGTLPP